MSWCSVLRKPLSFKFDREVAMDVDEPVGRDRLSDLLAKERPRAISL
jgi:hypothetical protein